MIEIYFAFQPSDFNSLNIFTTLLENIIKKIIIKLNRIHLNILVTSNFHLYSSANFPDFKC